MRLARARSLRVPESSVTGMAERVGRGSMAPEQATANAVPQAAQTTG
jgi:hypothetical protein